MIDLIIVSYNGKELTRQAIESAINNSVKPQKIILVDNNSIDGTVDYIRNNFSNVHCISLPFNAGYGKAINIGFKYTNSKYVVIANNDVIFPEFFFEKVLDTTLHLEENFGVIGFQQIFPDGSFQNSYGRFHNLFSAFLDVTLLTLVELRVKKIIWKYKLNKKLKRVDYVDGAIFCVNKNAFEKINGFDEDFFFYSEEVDLCKRMKKNGFSVWFDSNNIVIHYRGQGKTNKLGLSENSIPQFVKARSLYCLKHLGKFSTSIYLLIESIFYFEISFIFRLKYFLFKNSSPKQHILTRLISKEFLREFFKLTENFSSNK